MEEMSEFMTLPNDAEINNVTFPNLNLEMTISQMDPTTNKIDYRLFLTFDFAPDVTIGSEQYSAVVPVSKELVNSLFRTYNNIVDTVAVFYD
jgi:hypothetical protein